MHHPTTLIETIRICNGQIFNIEWHNLRFNRTRKKIFGVTESLNLKEFIDSVPLKGLFRCRVLYAKEIISIEYIPYSVRNIKTLKIVQSNIEYNFKYSNRELLDSLKKEASAYDDILIEKDGLLTDTSIANIAFYDGDLWLTPQKPLLEGTMRAKLLDNKFLTEKNLKSDDIKHFSNFALMNAMIGFQIKKDIKID